MSNGVVGTIVTGYINDDWVLTYSFMDQATGAFIDVSALAFAADLVIGTPYTVTPLTGLNGSVDVSQAANGLVQVTVFDALTSTLTPDADSVDVVCGPNASNTRVVLYGTYAAVTTTYGIIPMRVLRR